MGQRAADIAKGCRIVPITSARCEFSPKQIGTGGEPVDGSDALAGQPERVKLRREGLPPARHTVESQNENRGQDFGHPRSGATFAPSQRENHGELWRK